MTEASQSILVAFVLIGIGVTWQTIRTAQVPINAPDRLVSVYAATPPQGAG